MIIERLEKVRYGRCERCGGEWRIGEQVPARCGKCGTRGWNVPVRNPNLSRAMKESWKRRKSGKVKE